MMHSTRFWAVLLSFAVWLGSSAAWAAVKFEGSWPEVDKSISLDASALPRSEAVRRIADAAGWNVVWASPAADPVDIHVKKQPATKVLELVLSDGDYVARRQGDLIQIERDKSAAPPVIAPAPTPPPAPPAPPSDAADAADAAAADDDDDDDPKPPPSHGHAKSHRDRTVFGGHLRVEKDETVKDVTVLGGSADIYGSVSGDVSVLGGNAHFHPGSHVSGDVEVLGGSLKLDDDTVVEGNVHALGGELDKAPGAKVHGQVTRNGRGHDDEKDDKPTRRIERTARAFGGPMTRTAMLFVFGAVLLALVTRRMSFLQSEVEERPMRTFAIGVVGSIALIVVAGLLCVTLIGIPVAGVGMLAAIFGAYAGVCAVLTAVGSFFLRRWTDNPYLHLAAGCTLFLLFGFIPYAGTWITIVVLLTGVGTVVATRAAGFIPPKGGFSSHDTQQPASAV